MLSFRKWRQTLDARYLALLTELEEEHEDMTRAELRRAVEQQIEVDARRAARASGVPIAVDPAIAPKPGDWPPKPRAWHMPLQCIDVVIDAVALHYALSRREITSSSRERRIVIPAQVAAYLAREMTGHTWADIGRAMGRDYTGVAHACRLIARMPPPNLPQLREEVSEALAAVIRAPEAA